MYILFTLSSPHLQLDFFRRKPGYLPWRLLVMSRTINPAYSFIPNVAMSLKKERTSTSPNRSCSVSDGNKTERKTKRVKFSPHRSRQKLHNLYVCLTSHPIFYFKLQMPCTLPDKKKLTDSTGQAKC